MDDSHFFWHDLCPYRVCFLSVMGIPTRVPFSWFLPCLNLLPGGEWVPTKSGESFFQTSGDLTSLKGTLQRPVPTVRPLV